MATIRTLQFFPQVPLIKNNFLPAGQCLQPAGNFEVFNNLYNPPNLSFAPATLPYSQYIPLSFERAMAWYWKIKSWRITVNAEFYFDNDGDQDIGTINTSFLAENRNFILDPPYANEKEKLCNPSNFEGSAFYYQDGIEPITAGDWYMSIDIGSYENVWVNYPNAPNRTITDASASIRWDGTNYWMPVSITIVTTYGGGFGAGVSYNGLIDDSDAENLWSDSDNISWSLDDGIGSITKPFKFDFGTWLPNSTVNIEVEEYWPYNS